MLPAWRPSKLTRRQLEERRLHGQQLLREGYTTKEITQAFGVPRTTLRNWRQKLRQHGEDALHATTSTGWPRQLNDEQLQHLPDLLRVCAKAHGHDDETWMALRVREVIGQHFDVWYHRDHVSQLLRELGFSYQKPETRALERNEERIRTWAQTTLPELGEKG